MQRLVDSLPCSQLSSSTLPPSSATSPVPLTRRSLRQQDVHCYVCLRRLRERLAQLHSLFGPSLGSDWLMDAQFNSRVPLYTYCTAYRCVDCRQVTPRPILLCEGCLQRGQHWTKHRTQHTWEPLPRSLSVRPEPASVASARTVPPIPAACEPCDWLTAASWESTVIVSASRQPLVVVGFLSLSVQQYVSGPNPPLNEWPSMLAELRTKQEQPTINNDVSFFYASYVHNHERLHVIVSAYLPCIARLYRKQLPVGGTQSAQQQQRPISFALLNLDSESLDNDWLPPGDFNVSGGAFCAYRPQPPPGDVSEPPDRQRGHPFLDPHPYYHTRPNIPAHLATFAESDTAETQRQAESSTGSAPVPPLHTESQQHPGLALRDAEDIPLDELYLGSCYAPARLFFHRYHYPSLSDVVRWIGRQCVGVVDVQWSEESMLKAVSVYEEQASWLCRTERVLLDVVSLAADFGVGTIDMARLQQHAHTLQRLETIGGSHRRLEELDVAFCQQHVPPLEELVADMKRSDAVRSHQQRRQLARKLDEEKLVQSRLQQPQPSQYAGEARPEHDWLSPSNTPYYDPGTDRRKLVRVDDAGTAATVRSTPLSESTGRCLYIVSSSFEELVLDSAADVCVAYCWHRGGRDLFTTENSTSHLMDAAARVLGQLESHTDSAAQVARLRLGVVNLSANELSDNWLDPAALRTRLYFGGMVLYPAGVKPSYDHYNFYEEMKLPHPDAPKHPAQPIANSLMRPTDMYPSPPSLSALLQWLHPRLKVSSFSLPAALRLVEQLQLDARLAAVSKLERLSVLLPTAQFTRAYNGIWRGQGQYRKWHPQLLQLQLEVSFARWRVLQDVDVDAIDRVCEPIEAAIQRLVDRIEQDRVAASYEEEDRSDEDEQEREQDEDS